MLSNRSLNVADEITGVTPLQIAVETENVDCVKEMIICGAQVGAVDKSGQTVFHYAARSTSDMIIQVSHSMIHWYMHRLLAFGRLLSQ